VVESGAARGLESRGYAGYLKLLASL